jgi:hypothetical protein
MRRMSMAAGIALVSIGLLAGPAVAGGKNSSGGTTGASLSLVLLNSTDGLPHWGQSVTYNVHQTATTQPYVHMTCNQGTTLVYSFSAGYYDGYPWSKNADLQSPSWKSGAADCVAKLDSEDGGRERTLAKISFHVYA